MKSPLWSVILLATCRINKCNGLSDKVCLYTNRQPTQTQINLYPTPQLLNTPNKSASPTDSKDESYVDLKNVAAVNSVTQNQPNYRQNSYIKPKKPFQTQNFKSNHHYNNDYVSFKKNETATSNKQLVSEENPSNKSLVCTVSNSNFSSTRIEGIALMN